MIDRNAVNAQVVEVFRTQNGVAPEQAGDMPLLLLTTSGARNGQPRLSPLAYIMDGDRYVVVASKGGSSTHPDWYHNIVANPDEAIHSKSKQLQSRITHNDGTIRVIYKFIIVTECRYRWNMDASASSKDGFSRSAICLPRNCKFPRRLQRLFWGLTDIV